jgi:hypothetical protein
MKTTNKQQIKRKLKKKRRAEEKRNTLREWQEEMNKVRRRSKKIRI